MNSKLAEFNFLQKAILGIILAVLAIVAWEFILTPVLQLEDAFIFNRPVDVRLGSFAKSEAIKSHPEFANLKMSLEPDDQRKGVSLSSRGTAHFYSAKLNHCYQEKFRCRYQPSWSGSWFSFYPQSVAVTDCAPSTNPQTDSSVK